MPTPDNEELTDAPSIVPDRDELASYRRKKDGKPKAKDGRSKSKDGSASPGDGGDPRPHPARHSSTLIYIVGAVTVIVIATAGAAGYLYTQLTSARGRVAALEQRLSSTDASVNQSSGALQVKINDINTALKKLRDEALVKKDKVEIDRRIEHQAARIDSLERSVKDLRVALHGIDKKVSGQSQTLASMQADIAKLPPLIDQSNQRIGQQQASLNALDAKLKALDKAQNKLAGGLKNTEDWIDSVNVFRKQVNREIINIKQQIAGAKPMSLPPGSQ